MLKSRNSPLLFKVCSWYLTLIVNRNFSGYSFNAPEVDHDEAILLLANHFSWWDGIFLFYINKRVFKKRFHVLVSQNEHHKYSILKYIGAFASEKQGKDTMDTLIYAGQLLNDPTNLVLVFPQGKIYSSHVSSINFEKGIMKIFNSSNKKFQVFFSTTVIDYSRRRPFWRTQLQRWEGEEYVSLQLLKSEYNKHYHDTIRNQNIHL
jgi:hypothetical protein